MRITLDIDDRLMAEALAATGLETEREVIELGLRTLLQVRRQNELRQLRGILNGEGSEKGTRDD
jgi:Arc/MetJ family transcription regulator